jgi:flagellar hook-associated protein 1 FlgK
MSILNVSARALMANQTILQTAGNNIANVNTPGYSRQSVVLETAEGQFTGGGYVGKGVNVVTIQRNYSEFLTRQAALASATSAGDATRAEKLKQLESMFPSGTAGLGAAVSDMLNAFSDVANAPTDLTARTVALTRANEMATRMRNTSTSLDDLQQGGTLELTQKISAINTLATSIAAVNDKIARAKGNGHAPNDLLDLRDQMVKELNQYIQTSSIAADDGTVGVFIGGSQALVLGTVASGVSLLKDNFSDSSKNKLAISRDGQVTSLNEEVLGGGEVAGLLRFQNTDLNEARNLLGRYALAISASMNSQHQLGLDLDGNVGGNLFTPIDINTTANIRQPSSPANTGTAMLGLAISDVTKFAASDYEVNFTGAGTGNITRRLDGVVTAFGAVPITIDGLSISVTAGTANSGDRFLIKPFNNSANNIRTEFATPRALAVASPVSGVMGSSNMGSLQQTALLARTNPPTNVPVTLTFTGTNSYTRSDSAGTFTYTSGQSIEGSVPSTAPLSQWSLTLQGAPKAGDTFLVQAQPAAYRNLNAGNASAMMGLRDTAMFDGAALTDGYASLISQIGIRAMSADYAANISDTIASSAEKERTGVSGVNLDEEASKLLQYQQAYQASAKMIQIANSIFDTLLQTMMR